MSHQEHYAEKTVVQDPLVDSLVYQPEYY